MNDAPVTPDWGPDALSAFLKAAEHNARVSLTNLTGSFRRLRDVDALFLRLCDNLNNTEALVPAFFVYRAHAAYRAAVRLSLSGQVPEVYSVLRTCLEHGVYAAHFFKHPEQFDTWQARNDSDDSRRRAKQAFQWQTVLASVAAMDRKNQNIASALYERLLDLGAHPNQLGLFSALTMTETPDDIHFDTSYLIGDSEQLRLALKTTAQVGVTSLRIVRDVFKSRSDLLGVTEKLRAVSRGL